MHSEDSTISRMNACICKEMRPEAHHHQLIEWDSDHSIRFIVRSQESIITQFSKRKLQMQSSFHCMALEQNRHEVTVSVTAKENLTNIQIFVTKVKSTFKCYEGIVCAAPKDGSSSINAQGCITGVGSTRKFNARNQSFLYHKVCFRM